MEAVSDNVTAIALIDGEHYPDVTRDTLRYIEERLGYRLVALVFLGGTEKLADPGAMSYRGLPVYTGERKSEALAAALAEHRPGIVLDLSDEPVVGYRDRFELISIALAAGSSYTGADFRFDAPARPFLCDRPSIGVWGTGKRVGKTAVSGCLARYLEGKGTRTCVITMGRGGPPEPELLGRPDAVDDAYLRGRAERGFHAASDHFEDAMMGKVVSVGCRRCGGGMAGEPFYSNVAEGARVACGQECDVVVCEGSGSAIPPVGVDAVLLVVGANQESEEVLSYLGPYRLLLSDVVAVTMCDDNQVSGEKLRELIDGIQSVNPGVKVLKTVFRPRPMDDIEGKKVFLTSTAPPDGTVVQGKYLSERYGAEVTGSSPNLADRSKLEGDLEGAAGADVMVTELKAAGVDTVSLFARRTGKEIVYLENVPVCIEGGLEQEFDYLEAVARERFAGRK